MLRAGIEALATAGTPATGWLAAGMPATGTPAAGMPAAAMRAAQDRLLVGLANAALTNDSPFLTRPATAEQRQILARLGCGQ